MKTKFTIQRIQNPDTEDEYRAYAILPEDGTRGFVIGSREQVVELAARLNRFCENGRDDGKISHLAEELGWQWLDITDAVALAREVNVPVVASTIRSAAARDEIRHARLEGKTWRFPQATFLYWLKKHPHKRGRRPKPTA